MKLRLSWTGRVAALGVALAFALPLAAAGSRLPATAEVAAPSAAVSSGQSSEIYLVELEGSAATFRKEAKALGLKYAQRFEYNRLFKGVSVRINANDVGKLAGVASVGNVYPARYFSLGPVTTADPELATAIQMTGADLAQAAGYTGAGVKVAVMDTGIDVDHADLGGDGNQAAPHSFPNARIVAGVDLVGDDYNADVESANYQPIPHPDAVPDDCNGHGTHVAGIVGANGAGPEWRPGGRTRRHLRRLPGLRLRRLGDRRRHDRRDGACARRRHARAEHVDRRCVQQLARITHSRSLRRSRRRRHGRGRIHRQQWRRRHLLGRGPGSGREGHRRCFVRQQPRPNQLVHDLPGQHGDRIRERRRITARSVVREPADVSYRHSDHGERRL